MYSICILSRVLIHPVYLVLEYSLCFSRDLSQSIFKSLANCDVDIDHSRGRTKTSCIPKSIYLLNSPTPLNVQLQFYVIREGWGEYILSYGRFPLEITCFPCTEIRFAVSSSPKYGFTLETLNEIGNKTESFTYTDICSQNTCEIKLSFRTPIKSLRIKGYGSFNLNLCEIETYGGKFLVLCEVEKY